MGETGSSHGGPESHAPRLSPKYVITHPCLVSGYRYHRQAAAQPSTLSIDYPFSKFLSTSFRVNNILLVGEETRRTAGARAYVHFTSTLQSL